MSKIKKEEVEKDLESKGWKLISPEYKNLTTLLEVECPEGHRVFKNYKALRNKCVCPICEKNPFKKVENLKIPEKKGDFRILALDQATIISGWSIFDSKELIKFGVFNANENLDTTDRIILIKQWLISMLDIAKPDLVLLEGIQLQKNPNSGQTVNVTVYETLAELLGCLKVVCKECQIPFKVVHSATWRESVKVSGRTRADKKRSAQLIIKRIYEVSVTNDEADAICIGLYGSKTFGKAMEVIHWH